MNLRIYPIIFLTFILVTSSFWDFSRIYFSSQVFPQAESAIENFILFSADRWIVVALLVLNVTLLGWHNYRIDHKMQERKHLFPYVIAAGIAVWSVGCYAMTYSHVVMDRELLTFLIALLFGISWAGTKNANLSTKTNILIGVLMIEMVCSLFVWNKLPSYYYRGLLRHTGIFNNPNTMGTMMGVLFILCLGKILKGIALNSFGVSVVQCANSSILGRFKQRKWFYLCGSGAVGAFTCILQTYSRGVLIAMLFACFVMLFWLINQQTLPSVIDDPAKRRFVKRYLGHLICFSFSVCVILILEHQSITWAPLRRLASIGNINDFSWRNRVDAWLGLSGMIANRPFTGWGWIDLVSIFDSTFRPRRLSESGAIFTNDYFVVACCIGLPGAVSLIYLCVSQIRVLFKRTPEYAAIISFLMIVFALDGGYFKVPVAAIFWAIVLTGTRD